MNEQAEQSGAPDPGRVPHERRTRAAADDGRGDAAAHRAGSARERAPALRCGARLAHAELPRRRGRARRRRRRRGLRRAPTAHEPAMRARSGSAPSGNGPSASAVRVEVESAPGEGTALSVRIPVVARVIRLLLADDHPVVRAGIRALLESEPDLEVVAEATTAEDAVRLAAAARHRPRAHGPAVPRRACRAPRRPAASASLPARAARAGAHELRHRRRHPRRDRGRRERLPPEGRAARGARRRGARRGRRRGGARARGVVATRRVACARRAADRARGGGALARRRGPHRTARSGARSSSARRPSSRISCTSSRSSASVRAPPRSRGRATWARSGRADGCPALASCSCTASAPRRRCGAGSSPRSRATTSTPSPSTCPGTAPRIGEPFTIDDAMRVIGDALPPTRGAPTRRHVPRSSSGLSLGGYLAIEFAARHPGRIDGLVAASCGIRPRGVGLAGYRRIAAAIAHLPDHGRALNDFMARLFLPPEGADDVIAGGVATRRDGAGARDDRRARPRGGTRAHRRADLVRERPARPLPHRGAPTAPSRAARATRASSPARPTS